MSYSIRILTVLIFISICSQGFAAPADSTLLVSVFCKETLAPLPYAQIRLYQKNYTVSGITNERGELVHRGNISLIDSLRVSMVGYQSVLRTYKGEHQVKVLLPVEDKLLPEVYVTAQETNVLQTTSTITREALTHIQPSSFTDIMALIPGHRSSDPNLSRINSIQLRVASGGGKDYATSSLGTAFIVDGATISSVANRQTTSTSVWQRGGLESIGLGVDMRSIPTDDIEQVEIIRGVPSVKYGNIVSGVVNIKRSIGSQDLATRIKNDLQSTLISVSKGWKHKENVSTLSLGYLSSNADPRTPFQSFRRINTSLRHRMWILQDEEKYLTWHQHIDLGTTIDNIKQDPEININPDDYFFSRNSNLSLAQKLTFSMTGKALKRLEIDFNASIAPQKIKKIETIITSSPLSVVTEKATGEHQGVFLPKRFLWETEVDGVPLSLNANLTSTWQIIRSLEITNGITFQFDKNIGKGERLASLDERGTKPRREQAPFRELPAIKMLSAYLEATHSIKLPLQMRLKMAYGLRLQSLIALGDIYTINNKPFIDPRANIQLDLPTLGKSPSAYRSSLHFAIGILTLMPTSAYLFSDPLYYDISELQYVDESSGTKLSRYKTYLFDRNNYKITPARNRKWEVRYVSTFKKWNLSIVYFQELMTNGFRSTNNVYPIEYNRYTYSPSLHQLSSEPIKSLALIRTTENGSATQKEGIEFTATSPRYSSTDIRLSINGAWLKTIYYNTLDVKEQGGGIVNGKEVSEVGIYTHEERKQTSILNTSCLMDIWLPNVGLSLSLGIESSWFIHEQNTYPDRIPKAYIDLSGQERPYTKESQKDPKLSQLIRQNSPYLDTGHNVPFASDINLKASKAFFNKQLLVALFVNRIWSYAPDYDNGGVTIRRVRKPYFGLELNYRLGAK